MYVNSIASLIIVKLPFCLVVMSHCHHRCGHCCLGWPCCVAILASKFWTTGFHAGAGCHAVMWACSSACCWYLSCFLHGAAKYA